MQRTSIELVRDSLEEIALRDRIARDALAEMQKVYPEHHALIEEAKAALLHNCYTGVSAVLQVLTQIEQERAEKAGSRWIAQQTR